MNLVNTCPDVPDNWRGNRADVIRLLGISPKTLDTYARRGRQGGGLDWLPGKRGKVFIGKEVKRFWREYR